MSAECGICCEPLQLSEILCNTPCGHVFHHPCLMAWFQRSETCPMCRERVSEGAVRRIYLQFSPDHPDDLLTILTTEIAGLKQMLLIKEAENDASNSKNAKLSALLNAKEMEIGKLEAAVWAAEEANGDLNNIVKPQKREIDVAKGNVARLRKDRDETIGEVMSKASKCWDLQQSVNTYNERVSQMEEEKRRMANEVTARDNVNKELLTHIAALKACSYPTEWKRISEMFPGTKEPTELVKLISELRRKLTSKTARCVELEKSCKKYFDDLTKERTCRRKLERDLKNRETEIAALRTARVETKRSVPSSKTFAGRMTENDETKQKQAKRSSREALATIDSNTESQHAPQTRRYNLRP